MPGGPSGLAYDPVNGQLFSGNYGNSSLTVINITSGAVVRSVPLSFPVEDPIFDSGDGVVYVAGGSVLYGVTASNDTLTTTTGVASDAEAYDPVNQTVYAISLVRNWVTVLYNAYPIAKIVMTNDGPQGGVYDPADHDVYIADYAGLAVIDAWTNEWVGNVSWNTSVSGVSSYVALDPQTNDLFVATEGGNPTGNSSRVTVVDATNDSVIASIPVPFCCGGDAYDPATGSVFVALDNDTSGEEHLGLVAEINTTSLTVTRFLVVLQQPQGVLYDPFNHEVYVADLTGGALNLLVPLHLVEFVETGLPEGTEWSIVANGLRIDSASPTIAFAGANGSYNYSVDAVENYTVVSNPGTASVSGSNLTVGVQFVPFSYPVSFKEVGAPTTLNWSVRVGTQTFPSSDGVVSSAVPNGTYSFLVDPPVGYVASPVSGQLRVVGYPQSFQLNFTRNSTSSGAEPLWSDPWFWVATAALGVGISAGLISWSVFRQKK